MNGSYFEILSTEAERRPMSVEELSIKIRAVLEGEFANVWVEGEVVNFVAAASGHWYFNLNDGKAQVRCVCWKGTNYRIRFKPKNGITVRIRGKISFYALKGEAQLVVESLEPSGEGALRAAFEQIKAKLLSEGLFSPELKRPIPFLPRRVGVVTSRSGAAFHDIYSVLTRRARSVSILLAPALVQGEGAADSIRKALIALNRFNHGLPTNEKIDVLIVGRGGGSAEDLWAFNDEELARTIRNSSIPVISAVGHEIDVTIADLAADIRASTPSAAAEIVAAKEADILAALFGFEARLKEMAQNRLYYAKSGLEAANDGLSASIWNEFREKQYRYRDIAGRLSEEKIVSAALRSRGRLDAIVNRNISAISNTRQRYDEGFKVLAAKLDSLSPLSVLTRGYSIVQRPDGTIIRHFKDVALGDQLSIRLDRGRLNVEVKGVEEK